MANILKHENVWCRRCRNASFHVLLVNDKLTFVQWSPKPPSICYRCRRSVSRGQTLVGLDPALTRSPPDLPQRSEPPWLHSSRRGTKGLEMMTAPMNQGLKGGDDSWYVVRTGKRRDMSR